MFQRSDRYAITRSRYLSLAEAGLALTILAGTIAFTSYSLREQSREQITRQLAQFLYQLCLSQKFNEGPETQLDTREKASDQPWAVLQTARLPQLVGSLGTRFFDANGKFLFSDPNVTEASVSVAEIAELRQLQPIAHLDESADLSEVGVRRSEKSPTTLLKVSIPLHSGDRQLVGVAQLILDGRQVAAEFRRLDRNLLYQASLNFVVAGGLIGIFMGLGFTRSGKVEKS